MFCTCRNKSNWIKTDYYCLNYSQWKTFNNLVNLTQNWKKYTSFSAAQGSAAIPCPGGRPSTPPAPAPPQSARRWPWRRAKTRTKSKPSIISTIAAPTSGATVTISTEQMATKNVAPKEVAPQWLRIWGVDVADRGRCCNDHWDDDRSVDHKCVDIHHSYNQHVD